MYAIHAININIGLGTTDSESGIDITKPEARKQNLNYLDSSVDSDTMSTDIEGTEDEGIERNFRKYQGAFMETNKITN